jgi:hypothetical protein
MLPFPMRSGDTSSAARTVQLKIEQATSGEERLLMAFEMSLFVRDLAAAGIRHDHPDWSDAEVKRELIRFAFLPDPLPRGLR